MIPEWLRERFSLVRRGETKQLKPSLETAITAWESDPEKNPGGYRIVRGANGKPVEIRLEKRLSTYLLNGKKKPLQQDGINNPISLLITRLHAEQFFGRSVTDHFYEIKGTHVFSHVDSGKGLVGFLYGLPIEKPMVMHVRIQNGREIVSFPHQAK